MIDLAHVIDLTVVLFGLGLGGKFCQVTFEDKTAEDVFDSEINCQGKPQTRLKPRLLAVKL